MKHDFITFDLPVTVTLSQLEHLCQALEAGQNEEYQIRRDHLSKKVLLANQKALNDLLDSVTI